MSVLNALAALLGALNRLLDLWRSFRERQAVWAEMAADQLRQQLKAGRKADEIDRAVDSADIADLRDRMRNYRRD